MSKSTSIIFILLFAIIFKLEKPVSLTRTRTQAHTHTHTHTHNSCYCCNTETHTATKLGYHLYLGDNGDTAMSILLLPRHDLYNVVYTTHSVATLVSTVSVLLLTLPKATSEN